MKQINIVNTYRIIEPLSTNTELNEKEQWALYQLRKKLRHFVEFQNEREEVIRSKYAEFADQDGMIRGEQADAYFKDIKELNEMDVELEEFEKPIIRMVKGIPFTVAESLEDFIEFIPND